MAGSPGFEPGKPPPKGGVIPFHHDPTQNVLCHKMGKMSSIIFRYVHTFVMIFLIEQTY